MKKIVIVHSCGFDSTYENPDDSQGKLRTIAAIHYIRRSKIKHIIFSGGLKPKNHNYSLAQAMKKFFAKYSIKQKLKLYCENQSIDTIENVKFSNKLLQKIEKEEKIKLQPTFISHKYHIQRIKKIASHNNIKNAEYISVEEELNLITIHKSEFVLHLLLNIHLDKLITLLAHKLRKK